MFPMVLAAGNQPTDPNAFRQTSLHFEVVNRWLFIAHGGGGCRMARPHVGVHF